MTTSVRTCTRCLRECSEQELARTAELVIASAANSLALDTVEAEALLRQVLEDVPLCPECFATIDVQKPMSEFVNLINQPATFRWIQIRKGTDHVD